MNERRRRHRHGRRVGSWLLPYRGSSTWPDVKADPAEPKTGVAAGPGVCLICQDTWAAGAALRRNGRHWFHANCVRFW